MEKNTIPNLQQDIQGPTQGPTVEQGLLNSAMMEIRNLRNANQVMSARLEMFDSLMLLFNTRPDFKGMGMTEDIAWQIERHLTEKLMENNGSDEIS